MLRANIFELIIGSILRQEFPVGAGIDDASDLSLANEVSGGTIRRPQKVAATGSPVRQRRLQVRAIAW
jgi:hypothetical protein